MPTNFNRRRDILVVLLGGCGGHLIIGGFAEADDLTADLLRTPVPSRMVTAGRVGVPRRPLDHVKELKGLPGDQLGGMAPAEIGP